MIGWRALAGAGHFGIGAPGGHSPEYVGLSTALGTMGLLFIGCGLAAWFRLRTPAAALLALYCLFYGMHWGGLVPAYNPWLNNTFSLLHLVLSGVLSQAFLLHFALVYPSRYAIVAWRPFPYILYAPVAGAIVLMFVAILLQRNAVLFAQINGWLLVAETVFTNGYFLLAVIAIWGSWFRTERVLRYQTGVNVLAIGLLVAVMPYVASVIVDAIASMDWIYSLGTAPYTLFFSVIPVTFLIAIRRGGNHLAASRPRTPQENL